MKAHIVSIEEAREEINSAVFMQEAKRAVGEYCGILDGLYEQAVHFPEEAAAGFVGAIKALAGLKFEAGGIEYMGYALHPRMTGCIVDCVGYAYVQLPPGKRKEPLAAVVNFLDAQNELSAKINVSFVDEPSLAGDIVLNRPRYHPNIAKYITAFSEARNWPEMVMRMNRQGELERSRFWLAYTVMHNHGGASLPLRREFYRTHNTDDSCGGAVAVLYGRQIRSGDPSYAERHVSDFDPAMHAVIRKKLHE